MQPGTREGDRLQELRDLLGDPHEDCEGEVLDSLEPEIAPRARGGSDVFFTAAVLDALPNPLAWTGLSPRMRAATLLAFHFAAGVVAVIVFRWASPQGLDSLFEMSASWLDSGGPSGSSAAAPSMSWGAGLSSLGLGAAEGVLPVAAAVSVVAIVALWASRSHTRAT